MPGFNFNAETLEKNAPFEAGWYPLKVTKIEIKPSSKDPSSEVAHIDFEVTAGERKECVIKYFISDKMPSLQIEFVAAFIEPEPNINYEYENFVGSECKGFIVYDPENRNNKVKALAIA